MRVIVISGAGTLKGFPIRKNAKVKTLKLKSMRMLNINTRLSRKYQLRTFEKRLYLDEDKTLEELGIRDGAKFILAPYYFFE